MKHPIHWPSLASCNLGNVHSNAISCFSQSAITIFKIDPNKIWSKLAHMMTGLSWIILTAKKFDAIPSYNCSLSSINSTSLISLDFFSSNWARSLTHCEFLTSGAFRDSCSISTLTLLSEGIEWSWLKWAANNGVSFWERKSLEIWEKKKTMKGRLPHLNK